MKTLFRVGVLIAIALSSGCGMMGPDRAAYAGKPVFWGQINLDKQELTQTHPEQLIVKTITNHAGLEAFLDSASGTRYLKNMPSEKNITPLLTRERVDFEKSIFIVLINKGSIYSIPIITKIEKGYKCLNIYCSVARADTSSRMNDQGEQLSGCLVVAIDRPVYPIKYHISYR